MEPELIVYLAMNINGVGNDIRRRQALCFIAEDHELILVRIVLWVGCKSLRSHLTEWIVSSGRERGWIDTVGLGCLVNQRRLKNIQGSLQALIL